VVQTSQVLKSEDQESGLKLKEWHLELMQDPKDGSPLHVEISLMNGDEILEGTLHSATQTYEIRNGIPRFVENDGYSANFAWQWKKWATVQYERENIGRPMEGWTEMMFLKSTQLAKDDFGDRITLDLGCGGGRFADRVIAFGGKVVAIDYSSAVDTARELLHEDSPDSLFIQCDALELPLKSGVIDNAYSLGVLHHTPSPRKGVLETHRVLKSGGRFALSVYPKGGYYGWPNVTLWRNLFNRLPENRKHTLAFAYSKFWCTLMQPIGDFFRPLTYPVRIIFPTVYLADLRWSILDTFDSLTTSFQSTHTYPEAKTWFEDADFTRTDEGVWGCNPIGQK